MQSLPIITRFKEPEKTRCCVIPGAGLFTLLCAQLLPFVVGEMCHFTAASDHLRGPLHCSSFSYTVDDLSTPT